MSKCFMCNKDVPTPYHITEIENNKAETYDMCKECGEQYTKETMDKPKNPEKMDLTDIKTPEELLKFIGIHIPEGKEPCPSCGMTVKEFDCNGKFGCPKCYDHFTERMKELVYPYHNGAKEHTGKAPKINMANIEPEEKRKILKLKLAHAIEFEEYEDAAIFKQQLDALETD